MHSCIHHHFGRFRGHHVHGFGFFGKGSMEGGGMGGRGFGMGRKLGSADLQLLILRLLDEKPSHGYEIIKALDEHSNGFYVPSPGMVYPALTYLEELGFATVEAVGARKQYHISAAGKEHLEKNRAAADALFAQFGRIGERMDRVRRALDAEDAGEESSADRERRGSKELLRARRDLKLALLDKWNSSREEQLRIAEILKRAAAEISSQ
ncbi:MAG TPA: PadR family transcriptional regulator [Steroidobacteraceae bacterium]|nr:PadR family transcriptional regulator [Steroidobacteraceae bacterium]